MEKNVHIEGQASYSQMEQPMELDDGPCIQGNVPEPIREHLVKNNVIDGDDCALLSNSVDPNSVDPSSVNPNSVDPNSVDPNSVDPNSVDPNCVNLNCVNPNSANPILPSKPKSDPELLARVTMRYPRKNKKMARVAMCYGSKNKKKRDKGEKHIAKKKGKRKHHPRHPDVVKTSGKRLPKKSSDVGKRLPKKSSDVGKRLPKKSSRRNPSSNPQTTITNTSASSSDLISFRNLKQHFHTIPAHLQQYRPNSINNSVRSCRKNSCFKPSYVFRDLLYTANNNEAEEFPCERRISQPNFPMKVLSEDQCILREIREVFREEKKLKDSLSQTETLNGQQTVDKDVPNPSDQDNQDCYDWDKYLDRWEGLHINSESTSEAPHHEHKTIEKPEDSLPAKRKESTGYQEQAKKRCRIADSSEMIASTSFKSISSDKEHSSNREFDLPSFQSEMEMIVHPVSLDISETSTASKLEKFIKNTKINIFENNEMPPFLKKIIELESLPDTTNGSCMYMFENPTHVGENITGDTINSTDKIEELTSVERDDGVTEMDT